MHGYWENPLTLVSSFYQKRMLISGIQDLEQKRIRKLKLQIAVCTCMWNLLSKVLKLNEEKYHPPQDGILFTHFRLVEALSDYHEFNGMTFFFKYYL